MAVKSSESLINFIKQSEGFRSSAYNDFTGKKTVGYGTSDGEVKNAVSPEEADRLMRERVKLAEQELSGVITRSNLTQEQQDALIDMHYNLGGSAMTANGFIDLVNAGRDSEVSQQIQKYTKARNPKTGQLEELPGLVERVKQRSLWWNGVKIPSEANAGFPDENTNQLMESMNAFDEIASDQEDNYVTPGLNEDAPLSEEQEASLVQRTMEQFDAIGVIAPENIDDRINAMNSARGVMSPEESARSQKVAELSKELNISPLIIDADLEIYSEDEIRTRAKIPEIARQFPTLAKWAARPENYVLMEQTKDWTTSLNVSAQKLNPSFQQDFENTVRNSIMEYPKAAVYTLMLYGALDVNKAKDALKEINQVQQEFAISKKAQEETDRLNKVGAALQPKILNFIESLDQAWDAATDDDLNTAIMPKLKQLYDGTTDSLLGVLRYLKAMYENPTAAKLTATQAAVSSGLPVAIGVGGAAVGRPIMGAIGAFSSSAMLSVAESIQEDLEEYRDPNTGELDLELAFSNPERVARWRKRAGAYGAVMGLADMIYSKYVGEGFTKIFKKGGKGAIVKGAAKEVAKGAVEEGASQFTATVARDAVVGEATKETVARAGAEATTEAIYGGIVGGSLGSATTVLKTGKQKFYKMKHALDESNRANNDMFSLHETKVVMAQEEAAKTNPTQVKELIDESVNPPPIPDDIGIYDEVEVGSESLAEERDVDGINGTIQVAPSEIIEFFNDLNLNAEDEMRNLPPAIYEQFIKNRDSDSSINIDVSDWMQVLQDYPEVDEIVRINGNEYNAREANEVVENIQKDPFALYQRILDEDAIEDDGVDESDLPPTPLTEEEQAAEAAQVTELPGEPGEIITLSEIKTKFRSEDDTKAFNTIKNRLAKASKIKGIDPEAIAAFTEIQYARVKTRAEVMGMDPLELARSQTITIGRSNRVYGSFNSFMNNVFFAQAADPATVVHEFGHSWLHELSDDYIFLSNIPFDKMTPAQKDYWYSMETTAKLLNLENIGMLNGMDRSNPEYTNAHETFAQTTEEYFLSGKFGNSRVKAAMEAFRKYMVNIWEAIRRYAAQSKFGTLKITPEVERMFEGIIGVDHKTDEILTPMFPDPMMDPSLLGDKAQEYYNTTRDALAESVGLFASRIMKASYKDREKLIDTALNDAYDKASNLIDSQPEMVLAAQMKDQYAEYRKAVKSGKKVSDPRISYSSFVKLFDGDETAADIAKGSIPNYVIAGKKKGGIDAQTMMYNLGLTNAGDLVDMLMVIGSRDQLVDRKAQEIIEENYPALLNDQQIRDEAVKSLSNEKTSKFLRMEMKMLAEKYLPTLKNLSELFITTPETMMKQEYIDNKAKGLVTDARAYKFSSRMFRVDYGRQARKAARAFKQGDFAKAFDFKVKSAINYRAHVFAQGAQVALARTNKRIKQFKKYTASKDYAKKFTTELMLYGKAVIDVVENNGERLPRLDLAMFPYESGVTQNIVDSINQAVKRFEDRTKGRYGAFISVGNYVELGELIRLIQKQARNAKQVEVGNTKVSLEIMSEQIAEEIQSSTSRAISYEAKGYGYYKIAKDTMYTVFSSLYKNDIEFSRSALGTVLADLEDKQADRNLVTREDINNIIDILEDMINALPKGSKAQELLSPIVSRHPWAGSVWNYGKGSEPIIATELGITFDNIGEYFMAELLMGSPSGAEKFLRGGTQKHPGAMADFDLDGGLDISQWVAFRNRMISEGRIKKEHFEGFQKIWDMFRAKYPQVKESFRKTDGYLIGEVEGWDVNTPFGTFKGAYIPLSPDKQLKEQATFESLVDPDTNGLSATSLYPVQNTGMTNQRNDKFYPLDLELNRLPLYMRSVNDLIYLRSPLMTLGKIFLNPDVRQAFETKRPGAFKNMLTPWYERVKNQQRSEPTNDVLAKVASKIRANVNRSIYLFRLLTPLKQVFGLIPAASSVRPKYLIPAILETGVKPSASIAEVTERSKVMRERFDASVRRHINDWDDLVLKTDWVTKADEAIDKVTYFAIQFMQNRVDTSIWLGAFEQALDEGLRDSDAIHFADTAVQSTQAGSTVSYLNNFQTRSAISKFVQGIATSYLFAINNVVTKKAMREPTKVAQAKSLIALGLALYIIPNIMDQALEETYKSLAAGEDDDEDIEDKLTNIAKRSAMGSLSTIAPIVGSSASSYMFSGNVDFAPIFTKLARESTYAVNGLTKNSQGVNMTPREIKALLNTITIFSGIPTSALAKDLFVEDVYIEGLSGEELDARLRERKFQLRQLKMRERMQR